MSSASIEHEELSQKFKTLDKDNLGFINQDQYAAYNSQREDPLQLYEVIQIFEALDSKLS